MEFLRSYCASGDSEQKPLLAVRIIVKHPLVVIGVSLVAMIVLTAIAISLPFTLDKRTDSFRVLNHPTTRHYDAFDVAEDTAEPLKEVDEKNSKRDVTAGLHERRKTLGGLELYYVAKNPSKNILEPELLKEVRQIENMIMEFPGYDKFCKLHEKKTRYDRDGTHDLLPPYKVECEEPLSLMNFFYPSLNASEDRHFRLYDVADFDGKGTKLYPIFDVSQVIAYTGLKSLVSSRFNTWYRRSEAIRSVFQWGMPLAGYNDTEKDEKYEMRLQLTDWIKNLSPKLRKASTDNINVYWAGTAITDWEVDNIIVHDALFALGSIAMILVWMLFHTRSFVLSVAGLFHVIMSIPTAYFFLRVLGNIQTIGILHCMVLFIILGIGCDDIFIFIDAWKQSTYQGPKVMGTMLSRMDWVYRRSAYTMFITSFTTAAAFYSNSISPIVPIRLFGIFMGTIVMTNYILVITWYPAVVVVWDRYCNCSLPCKKGEKTDHVRIQNEDSEHDEDIPLEVIDDDTDDNTLDDNGDSPLVPVSLKGTHKQEPIKEELRLLERYFYFHHVPFLHKYRYAILIVFAIALGLCLYFTITGLKPHTGLILFFPYNHRLSQPDILETEVFKKEGWYQSIYLVWGVKGIDRSDIDVYNPQDKGEVIWDSSFDLATPESQQFILDICNAAKTAKMANGVSLVRENVNKSVTCFMEGFKNYQRIHGRPFPVNSKPEFWAQFKQFLRKQPKNETDDHIDRDEYSNRLGWTDVPKGSKQELLYASIEVRTPLIETMSGSERLAHYDGWNAFLNNHAAKAPASAKNGFVVNESWVIATVENTLIRTAAIGATISIVFAFVVLLFSTLNIFVALYSTLSIIFVVITLLGYMAIISWTIGIIESVSLTVIVGLSVDYSVHLAVAYMKAIQDPELKEASRKEMMQHAMLEIGISILGGAVTTSSSVFMLFFATITFFSKFGVFVFVNIVSSLVLSLIFLCTLLLVIGPRGKMGDLVYITKHIFCCKQE